MTYKPLFINHLREISGVRDLNSRRRDQAGSTTASLRSNDAGYAPVLPGFACMACVCTVAKTSSPRSCSIFRGRRFHGSWPVTMAQQNPVPRRRRSGSRLVCAGQIRCREWTVGIRPTGQHPTIPLERVQALDAVPARPAEQARVPGQILIACCHCNGYASHVLGDSGQSSVRRTRS